jgi:polysaccharide chain length determinant protein (PEP-CTERM system associated)
MNSLQDEILTAIHAVWNRRWLALAVTWGVCLVGWLIVALIPNSYESKARIFVQLDDALAEQVGIQVADRKREIERIRQTLTSAVNLEKVVRSTQLSELAQTPMQMEKVVLGLAEDIKVVSEQENLFEITATVGVGSFSDTENARLAQNISQKMIDIFREENLSGNKGEVRETLAFVTNQLAQREKALEAAEQKRLAFEAQHPEMIQGGAANLQRMETSRTTLRDIEADIAAAQSAVAAIGGQLAGTPKNLPGGAINSASASLAAAQNDLASMKARGLTDSHPDVISARNQVALLRQAARAESQNGSIGASNPAYTSLLSIKAEREANLMALQSRRAAMQSELAMATARQIDNPEVAAEAQRINRDYDVLRKQYDELLQDREVLRLRGEVRTEREAVKFEVVDPPTTPLAPAAPNRPLLLLGVLIVGLGAGCATAFAMSKLRSTFATSGRLERVSGLPVLGTISQTVTLAQRAFEARRMRLFYGATAGLGGVFILLLAAEFIQRGMVA